jgi:hypothetical protein
MVKIITKDIDFSIESKSYLNVENLNCTGQIGLKAEFVLLILRSLDTEKVTFRFKDSKSAIFINDILLMPMLINLDDDSNTLHLIKDELTKEIEALSAEISQKERSAQYLMNNKRGAWGRKTNADEKRERELSKLNSKLTVLLRKQAKTEIKEVPQVETKPEIEAKEVQPKTKKSVRKVRAKKIIKPAYNEVKLNRLLLMKKRHDFLFTSERKYIQKYASL